MLVFVLVLDSLVRTRKGLQNHSFHHTFLRAYDFNEMLALLL